jgi:hypothetical protein
MIGWVLLFACTGPGAVDSTADSDLGFEVSGQVADLDGQPVVGVFVTVSTEFCIPDQTDESGTFTVGQVVPGPKRLITYGETATNGLFASVVFAFEADSAVWFEQPVLAPALTEIWPLDLDSSSDLTVQSNDGLTLQISAGSLTMAPFAPGELQVARVPVDQAPDFVPEGIELVDLFALHPIQSTFDPPAPVSFPSDTGLTVGTAVTFHALDYESGLLIPVATGTVDSNGHPTTAPGQGLPELTWVGISTESS